MVVKILNSSASFRGVDYNTNKIDNGRGELMQTANFGPLESMVNLRPEDYKSYLQLISSQNKKIENPQLHVALSCLGKEYDKHQLTEMGKQWLQEMGYGDNPYLIIFHKDTDNNHVHLVSTRINKEGKKIKSDYERIRSMKFMNRIIGLNEKQKLSDDIKKCLAFNFKTKPQFLLLLEQMGYSVKPTETGVELIKYGISTGELSNENIESGINTKINDPNRVAQIRAIIEKYRTDYSTDLYLKTIISPKGNTKKAGYTSELAEHLKDKFGIDLIFHAKENKTPYGFSIIDNSQKSVLKGGEVITLKELLSNKISQDTATRNAQNPYKQYMENRITSPDELVYYKTLIRSIINNYGLLQEGLQNQGFDFVKKSNDVFIIDIQGKASISLSDLMPEKDEDYRKLASLNEQFTPGKEIVIQESFFNISFGGGDIDDEAILGRNRSRKGMSRTKKR